MRQSEGDLAFCWEYERETPEIEPKVARFKTRGMPDMCDDGSSGPPFASRSGPVKARRPGTGQVQPIPSVAKEGGYAEATNRTLSAFFAPTALLVDRRGDLKYCSGPVHHYLDMPNGDITPNLIDIARDGLKGMLQRLIHRAARPDTEIIKIMSTARVRRDGAMVQVYLSLVPVTDAGKDERLFLVCFADEARSVPMDRSAEG